MLRLRFGASALAASVVFAGGCSARAQTPGEAPRIELAELKRLSAAGGVLIVDVRAVEAYRSGHIPGSVSIPANEAEQRVGELKGKKTIVAYCA